MKTHLSAVLVILLILSVPAPSSLTAQVTGGAVKNREGTASVTAVNGFYRQGQVFLTWNNLSNSNTLYKVYRAQAPILHGAQLNQAEYLGHTWQYSAKDIDLSIHYGTDHYLRIDSGGIPLPASCGLFVATTLANGSYYYAVTTLLNESEDTTIVVGLNSTASPIQETVMHPHPVFQQNIAIHGKTIELYTNFYSFKTEISKPPILPAGFIASDFLLFRNNNTGNQPLVMQMHGGGSDFFSNIDAVSSNEMNLNIESNFPAGDGFTWGANSNFDIYHENETVPVSGVNYNFLQQIYLRSVDWAMQHLDIDSNRIYLTGTSAGACGAYMLAITYPEKFAAVQLGVPCYNIGFQNDSVPYSSFNPGMASREKADHLIGAVSANLPSNLGYPTFDVVNGGWRVHESKKKDFPFIYAMNGKNDIMVGWTEKTAYYDSVNANATGGYYFWDGRTHGGSGAFWGDHYFDLLRFRRNSSYPAFANCSLNEDYGNGAPTSGAAFGTVNGALNWFDPIIDSISKWKVSFFIRDLASARDGLVVYPDSATVDVTPRRVQQFHVPPNAMLHWSVTHHESVIQEDSFFFEGGLITVYGVKAFKDTADFQMWYAASDSFNTDADGDHYTTAQGDCNDHNAAVHPGATDVCNGVDDNCDGTMDENAIVATVTPAGSISVCNGTAVTLTANDGSGIEYQWLKNGTPIPGETKLTFNPTQSASYSVSESNSFMCSSVSPATVVTFLNLPVATVTPLGDLDICAAGFVDLQASTGSKLSYQWKKGSNNIAGATNQIYTAMKTGTYKVTVTNKNGCSKTSAGVKVTKSCKGEISDSIAMAAAIFLYPNPTNGNFMLELHTGNAVSSEMIIEISDLNGKTVYSELVPVTVGFLKQELELNLADGFYLVRGIQNNQIIQKKLVINH